MSPEDYQKIVDELSDPETFIKPVVPYSTDRVCNCGKTYKLGTPYEKCNEEVRDMCDDCLSKYWSNEV